MSSRVTRGRLRFCSRLSLSNNVILVFLTNLKYIFGYTHFAICQRLIAGNKKNMTKNEADTGQSNIDAGYEEIDDPNFFKFESIGDKIKGQLVDIGWSDQYDFGLYTVEDGDKNQTRFHGSSQLDSRMKQVSLGDHIVVEFMDIEKRPKGDMKLFRVMRKSS